MTLPSASAFADIGKRFESFGKSIPNIFKGVGDGIIGLGEGLKLGVTDIGKMIDYSFVFLGTYIGCGVGFLTNLKSCIFYYLLECLGQILYLPIRLTLWISQQAGADLSGTMSKFWDFMEMIDRSIYKGLKFHIIHYPGSVVAKCYVCKRLKQTVLSDQGEILHDDFEPHDGEDSNILQKIKGRAARLYEGGRQFKNSVRPMGEGPTDPYP